MIRPIQLSRSFVLFTVHLKSYYLKPLKFNRDAATSLLQCRDDYPHVPVTEKFGATVLLFAPLPSLPKKSPGAHDGDALPTCDV